MIDPTPRKDLKQAPLAEKPKTAKELLALLDEIEADERTAQYELAQADMRISGAGYVRLLPGGKVERIDPATIWTAAREP